MTTADMAMIRDPDYRKISKRFHENPDQFADASQERGSNYYTETWGLR